MYVCKLVHTIAARRKDHLASLDLLSSSTIYHSPRESDQPHAVSEDTGNYWHPAKFPVNQFDQRNYYPRWRRRNGFD